MGVKKHIYIILLFIVFVLIGGILFVLKDLNQATSLPVSFVPEIMSSTTLKTLPADGSNDEYILTPEQAIKSAFQSTEPWKMYTNVPGTIALRYPKMLFRTDEMFDIKTGLSFSAQSKQERDELFQKNTDGVCDGLADLDCEKPYLENEKDFSQYIAHIEDQDQVPYDFEAITLDQNIRTLNGIPFLVWVSLNVNGGANLSYLSYHNDTMMRFDARLIGDRFFDNYTPGRGNMTEDPFLSQYVKEILDGDPQNSSTKAQKTAIEYIIEQIVDPRDRILISRGQIQTFRSQLPDPCEFGKIDTLHFSTLDTTATTTYTNREKDIEFSLPYNPELGFPKYRLNPYDEYNGEVFFGSIYAIGEGCGSWVSGTTKLKFLPAETLQETLSRLEKMSDDSEYGYEIKVLSIGGKTVVEYLNNLMCDGGGTIIIGKKYNYEFSSRCGLATDKNIIKSIKFISDEEWQLLSGDPTDGCSHPVWSGNVSVRAWSEYTQRYGDHMDWALFVQPEDIKKFPYHIYTEPFTYYIDGATPNIETRLRAASEDNPFTVIAKGFQIGCEGDPVVYFTTPKPRGVE